MNKDSDYFVIITILLQTLLVITINTEIIVVENLGYLKQAIPFINLIILIMCVISLISVKNIGRHRVYRTKALMMKNHLTQVEELIRTLQAERHEYSKHMQAIQSLMGLGRIDEAIDYMDSITEGIIPQYEMCYIDHPALSALLNSKKAAAEKKGIDVGIFLHSELSNLDIPSRDVCSIVGNLVDNALEAAVEADKPRVEIEFRQDHDSYIIDVYNNGAAMPAGVDVFQAGVSTKISEYRGYGLYIVQKLLKKHNGQIEINCDDNTHIRIRLPSKVLKN
jgi:sensor histidine kinase regulating citrate/malate metabolism